MKCLAVYDSGNFAYRVCSILERKGYIFEVISIPCKIAIQGCGYCLEFPEDYIQTVLEESEEAGNPVRIIYKKIPGLTSNKYKKIYP